MKKTLLLGTLLFAALAANAQTPIQNGADAPQIIGNRITSIVGDEVTYGEEISLQAYLDAGKTVIIDMSAAWCGPCWSFHQSHTLEKLYAAYGPEGSDELRVIFIEADPSTNVLELGGQSLPPENGMGERGPSQGDWLAGSPYPIINNDDASDAYGLEAFPSLYIITPNASGELGTVTNLDWDEMGAMLSDINDAIGTDLVGIDHLGKITAAQKRLCDATAPVTAVFEGYGHAVTSFEAQLKKDGEVVATQTFTANLDAFEPYEAIFNQDAETGAVYQAILTKVNDAPALTTIEGLTTTDEYTVTPGASVESSNNVSITINTDDKPAEMTAYIIFYDETDGGAYYVWKSPTYANTASNKEKTFTYYPDAFPANVCYGVYLIDNGGNGWVHNGTGDDVPHGITIKSGDTVLFTHDGNFQTEVMQDAVFRTDGTLATDKFEDSKFAVYPNPSTGIFTFLTEEAIDVTVIDITGKTVHTAKAINNGGSIDLSALQTGMYIAKIKGDSGERIEKLLIK